MKIRTVIRLLTIAALLLFVIPSCVKEGPAGLDGMDGMDGADGADGADGNVTCIVCHNSENMSLVEAQYETSIHALSPHLPDPTYIYAGRGDNRKSCAVCHTHEGFVEVVFTGRDTLMSSLAAPTRIGCETCHSGHVSFDFETDGPDYALRTNDGVTVDAVTENGYLVDLGSNSNLCVNCHQPRSGAPVGDESGNYSITSSRYGPHHGPQGTLLEGVGGYETIVSGGESYPAAKSHPHREAGCTTCHMKDGDHSFMPKVDACKVCHTGATDFDIDELQSDIEEMQAELKALLIAKGALSSTGSVIGSSSNPNVLPIDVAGALFNYVTVEEDRSLGVHNPDYIEALLKNSIKALE